MPQFPTVNTDSINFELQRSKQLFPVICSISSMCYRSDCFIFFWRFFSWCLFRNYLSSHSFAPAVCDFHLWFFGWCLILALACSLGYILIIWLNTNQFKIRFFISRKVAILLWYNVFSNHFSDFFCRVFLH